MESEPAAATGAGALATKMINAGKWIGKYSKCLRWIGRGLLIVTVVVDGIEVYKAKDHVKAGVEKAGGWAGALAGTWTGAKAAGLLFLPAEAEPGGGTLVHGIATFLGGLGGGIAGYWIGSNVARKVYEVIAENW